MSFLRIGTNCVVVNDDGHVLLSQRGDLNTWNLPGGRLDRNEYLWDAAAREVHEETGIEAEIIRLTGLYYSERWNRLNAVFLARPTSGALKQKTFETRRNEWFNLDHLPDKMFDRQHILDALGSQLCLRTLTTSIEQYRKLRRKFALRWIENLLRGRPEPRYPRFTNVAVLLSDSAQPYILNHFICDGTEAPWLQVTQQSTDIPDLIGIHHLPLQAEIRFIFAQHSVMDSCDFNQPIEDTAKNDYSRYLTLSKNPESAWLMSAEGNFV